MIHTLAECVYCLYIQAFSILGPAKFSAAPMSVNLRIPFETKQDVFAIR